MTEPDVLSTTLRFLDGELPSGELPALIRRLREQDGDRRQVARLLLQLGQLRDLRPERRPPARLRVAPPLAAPVRGRRWRIGAAVAVAAALAVAVPLLWPGEAPPGQVAAPAPAAHRSMAGLDHQRHRWREPRPPGQPPPTVATLIAGAGHVRLIDDDPVVLRPGARVLNGQGVETVGPAARAVLSVAGGARLELEGNTQVVAVAGPLDQPGRAADRVLLERGSLRVDLESVPGSLTVVSPVVEVRARLSQFRLTAATGELRVSVDSGQVMLVRLPDGHSLTVEAGAAAMMTETQALAIAPPPRPVALLVVGSRTAARAQETDSALEARLEKLGYSVVRLPDVRLERAALADKALVVLSPSTSALVIRERLPSSGLREEPLPIVNCEIEAMPLLGMATATGMLRGRSRLNVQAETHALAAGLAGEIRVTDSPAPLMWARPDGEATVIATLDVERWPVVFGYEAGARMNGLAAPARRASCFFSELATIQASEAGWQLFDSAVRWAGPIKR